MNWDPATTMCCIIGAGDFGKSTILDAVEAALSARWTSFSEPDFFGCDTASNIEIEATIGELSESLKSDERFGLYVRGWTEEGIIRDEPEGTDEPVLTIRLTVDATLEPVWELICERIDLPRTLSSRDRLLFGLVRLSGEDSRHLAWGQGSVLSRLTGEKDGAAAALAEAYRTARGSAKLDEIASLAEASSSAETHARSLGAYIEGAYGPGLELGRSGLSSSAIALHDSGVPLRLAGLGTRRLATLAIQRSAITEGAIILIDEIEHGLEPHRIIGAIAQLRADQVAMVEKKKPIGQILMTTHSDVVIGEIGSENLCVCQSQRPGRALRVSTPTVPETINPILRFTPRALFARRILITEGMTEVGLLLGIREYWPSRHQNKPIEQIGVAIADGNGGQAAAMALSLASLGYTVALYRDSDTELKAGEGPLLASAGIPVIEYGAKLRTEQAIFSAATDQNVDALLKVARQEKGVDQINDSIHPKIDWLDKVTVAEAFSEWHSKTLLDADAMKEILAEIAHRNKWFKDSRIARDIAPVVWAIAQEKQETPLAKTLSAIEAWVYG